VWLLAVPRFASLSWFRYTANLVVDQRNSAIARNFNLFNII
jgi:hypothetical protein